MNWIPDRITRSWVAIGGLIAFVWIIFLLFGCAGLPVAPIIPFDCDDPPDPPAQAIQRVADPVEGRYIVVYRPSAIAAMAIENRAAAILADAESLGASDVSVLGLIDGFVGSFSKRDAKRLAADLAGGRVLGVWQDGVKSVPPPVVVEAEPDAAPLSWGQDRLDDLEPVYDGTYEPRNRGAGVVVGILDTGIDDESADFEGRLVYCDTMHIDAFMCRDDGIQSQHGGHGTHVAGSAAGTTWGIAPEALIASVRVLQNGSGSDSDVIGGIQKITEWWQTSEHADKPLVVNMSLGGSPAWPLDYAVCQAIDQGAHFSIAAGNVDNSACHNSPARVVQALTIGATNRDDSRAYFSATDGDTEINPETGRPFCEGIMTGFEPGYQIRSTKIGCRALPCQDKVMSGTSMAAPHAAGAAAVILSEEGQMSPEALYQRWQETALQVVTDARSKHAILGYAGELP